MLKWLAQSKFTITYIQEYFFPFTVIRIGGNRFHSDNSPPWDFPLETVPVEQNISSPPKTQSSAIESYPVVETFEPKKKSMGPGGIAFIFGGGTLVASCIVIYISIRINQYRARRLQNSVFNNNSTHSLPITAARGELLAFAWKLMFISNYNLLEQNLNLYRIFLTILRILLC